MKAPVRTPAIEAVLMLLLFLFVGIYTSFGQIINSQSLQRGVNNTGGKIELLEGVNEQASATPLNNFINGPYAELKPALTPNGTRLYFSRALHPNNTGGEIDYEDIWFAEYDKDSNGWSEPARLPGFLNNLGPNFINSVSTTGDTIILGNQYLKKGRMRAGLSYSIQAHGQWSVPTPIEIEDDYNLSDHGTAYVSLKSGIIISAVQRLDTKGERDLYVSFWDGEKASAPVNMGGMINTEFEESSPYLSDDLKTMYFASKGHHGFGGYDIYVTTRLDDSWVNWSTPKNLGPAVNGKLDDEFFSLTHCGKFAIFSKKVSIHNTDLYKISLQELIGPNTPWERKNKLKQNIEEIVAAL